MLLVERERHAPIEGGAADREVLEAALHERDDLVLARLGLDEAGVRLVEIEQRLLEGRELEEPALLLDALERTVAVRAERVLGIGRFLPGGAARLLVMAHLRLGEIGLVRTAVPAVVGVLVDVAAVEQHLQKLLHAGDMARLGGADEVVVGDVERLPQIAKRRLHGVAPSLRRGEAVLLGGLGHLLAVLVHAGEELDVTAAGALEAGLRRRP